MQGWILALEANEPVNNKRRFELELNVRLDSGHDSQDDDAQDVSHPGPKWHLCPSHHSNSQPEYNCRLY